MENKYKNDIPNNIILDDAHMNCASIPFAIGKKIVWKNDALTMAKFQARDFNNGHASMKSDQVKSPVRHWTMYSYGNAMLS